MEPERESEITTEANAAMQRRKVVQGVLITVALMLLLAIWMLVELMRA